MEYLSTPHLIVLAGVLILSAPLYSWRARYLVTVGLERLNIFTPSVAVTCYDCGRKYRASISHLPVSEMESPCCDCDLSPPPEGTDERDTFNEYRHSMN